MDDNFLDNLITQATAYRNASAMPSTDFFDSITRRAILHRRLRHLGKLSAAAAICLIAAGSLWFFSSGNETSSQTSSANYSFYSESMDNASDRIEQIGSVQANLRESIYQPFPF